MNANQIVNGHEVQHDPSGVGHAWRTIAAEDLPASIADEIACWIIEDEPASGDEYRGTNGQMYRIPPTA